MHAPFKRQVERKVASSKGLFSLRLPKFESRLAADFIPQIQFAAFIREFFRTRERLMTGYRPRRLSAPDSRRSAQSDPFLGTWQLDLAKSKFSPGPPPSGQTLSVQGEG
jgi:hypothetical protein